MSDEHYKHINDRLRTIEKSVHFLEKREKSRRNFKVLKTLAIFIFILVAYYYLLPIIQSLWDSVQSIQDAISKLPL